MIRGLDKFKEHFADYSDFYVLIGGSASFLVMEDVGVDFRATKDLDIVLCVDVLDVKFAEVFWDFVKVAGYQHQQHSTGKKNFYRFVKPTNDQYPYMLELFSRKPDILVLGDGSHLTPIPIDDDVSSLSAILLDEDYYSFIQEYKIEIDRISVVTELCLIPLKAKAWLDLSARKDAGEKIESKVIKKHKNDIFRLFQILRPNDRPELPDSIAKDLRQYLDHLLQDPSVSLKDFGLGNVSVVDVVDSLESIYSLDVAVEE